MPTTLDVLAEYYAAGEVVDIEKITAQDESEEAEYDALLAAAESSERMLSGPGRRVVLVGDGSISPKDPIPFDRIDAVHMDTEDIVPGAEEVPELAWFAVQEIPALLH
jgi:hypothetical protein